MKKFPWIGNPYRPETCGSVDSAQAGVASLSTQLKHLKRIIAFKNDEIADLKLKLKSAELDSAVRKNQLERQLQALQDLRGTTKEGVPVQETNVPIRGWWQCRRRRDR